MEMNDELNKISNYDLNKSKTTLGTRVAIYCRVSTEDQSMDHQKAPLIRYAEDKEFLYEIFEEKISGAKDTRPELDVMMQRIRNGEFNSVLILKLDRLGRSLQHLLQLIEEFKKKDVKFICLEPQIDTNSTMGMFFFQITGAFAELERQMIRERTKTKLDWIKKQIKEKGFYINANGERRTSLGRPVGKKDGKRRVRSGYHLRWDNERKRRGK